MKPSDDIEYLIKNHKLSRECSAPPEDGFFSSGPASQNDRNIPPSLFVSIVVYHLLNSNVRRKNSSDPVAITTRAHVPWRNVIKTPSFIFN